MHVVRRPPRMECPNVAFSLSHVHREVFRFSVFLRESQAPGTGDTYAAILPCRVLLQVSWEVTGLRRGVEWAPVRLQHHAHSGRGSISPAMRGTSVHLFIFFSESPGCHIFAATVPS